MGRFFCSWFSLSLAFAKLVGKGPLEIHAIILVIGCLFFELRSSGWGFRLSIEPARDRGPLGTHT